jgi:hypothetical protein
MCMVKYGIALTKEEKDTLLKFAGSDVIAPDSIEAVVDKNQKHGEKKNGDPGKK